MVQKGPLAGIRVCDLSWILAAPTCTRYLANFGAEVIRVENVQTMDPLRRGAAESKIGGIDTPNRACSWNFWNTSKHSVTLNARHPKGMELLKRILAVSDVVVENFSSRVLENWDLGFDEMQKINPRIIYISLSGFGHSGRDRDYTTWGPTAQANSGLTFMSGLPGLPAAGYGFSYMDFGAGYYAFIAVVAALHYRNRTGRGQYIDLSQVEAGLVLTGPALLDYSINNRKYRRPDYPPGNRSIHPAVAPHGTYRCQPLPLPIDPPADDRWCVITVFNEEEWKALCRVMGDPEWTKDPRFTDMFNRKQNENELDRLIEEWTKQHTAEEVMNACQEAGVPCGVVQNPQDRADKDPQFKARGFYEEVDNPEFGPFRYDGMPVKLSLTPGHVFKHSPLLGETNDYFYKEFLGIPEEEYEQLKAEEVIQDMGYQQQRIERS